MPTTQETIQSIRNAFPMRTASIPERQYHSANRAFTIGDRHFEVTSQDAPDVEVSPYDFISTAAPGALLFFSGPNGVRSLEILLPYFMMYSANDAVRRPDPVYPPNVAPPEVASPSGQYEDFLEAIHPKFGGTAYNQSPVAEMIRFMRDVKRHAIADYILCDRFNDVRIQKLGSDDHDLAVGFLDELGTSDRITILQILSNPEKALTDAGAFEDWVTLPFTSHIDIIERATGRAIATPRIRLLLEHLLESGFLTGSRQTIAVMGKPREFLDPEHRGISHVSPKGRNLLL
jgi:hypothetical protein